jgi:hypothetical protein
MWRLTKLEIWVQQNSGGSGTVHVITSTPKTDKTPNQIIDDVSVAHGQLPAAWSWLNIPVSSPGRWLPASQGLCITLETQGSDNPAEVEYESGGLSDPSTGMLTGNDVSWNTPDTSKSIGYKIEAEYTTLDGGVSIVPGTWRQTPPP